MIHTCPRCGVYTTPLKTNLKRHLNRKRKCTQKPPHIESFIQKENPREPQIIQKEPQNIGKEWTCTHCSKSFSTNSHMNRHMRLYCKEVKLQRRVDELEMENQRLRSQPPSITNNNNKTTNCFLSSCSSRNILFIFFILNFFMILFVLK